MSAAGDERAALAASLAALRAAAARVSVLTHVAIENSVPAVKHDLLSRPTLDDLAVAQHDDLVGQRPHDL